MNLAVGGDGTPRRVLSVIRWPVGGIRTWCKYVYRAPQFSGFQIDLLAPAGGESDVLRDDLARSGLNARLIQTGTTSLQIAATAMRQIALSPYSLVHSHGFTSAVICTTPTLLRHVPHLVTVHEEILEEQYRDARGRIIRVAANAALAAARCVHAVSHSSKENLLKTFPGARRCSGGVRVISNGIEARRFLNAGACSIRHDLKIEPDALIVGYFGRFMAAKGFRYLIEAVRIQRDEALLNRRLVVLAVGQGGFRLEEEEVIRANGLEDRFFFLDFMPDIASVIRAVDVVAMPSLWEASGLLAMEVLSSGVPLVASDASGLREVCENTPARIFPRRDSRALLEALRLAASDSAKIAAVQFAPVAAKRFDADLTREKLSSLYWDLIAGSNVREALPD